MNFIDFAKTVGKLKKTVRTGWVRSGKVKDPESVADHVMRLTVLALVAGDELKVDTRKLVDMAIVHDLAESVVGDMVAEQADREYRDIKKRKFKLEKEAINNLFQGMKDRERLMGLWEEYEKQESEEARVLKQLDKFEMALQALEYEEVTDPKNLDEFWVNARKHVKHPVIRDWLDRIELERKRDG